MVYVTGAQILTHVGKTSPTADDTAWAGTCADAIEAALAFRLDDWASTAGGVDQLEACARSDGAALFNSRAAPHGVLSIGPDGDAVRLGADYIRACNPVIARLVRSGIG